MIKKHITLLALLSLFACACTRHWQPGEKTPSGYANNTLLKAAYFLGFIKLVDKNPPVPNELIETKSISYKTIDSISLKLDIYRKKEMGRPAPLLIFIHGGGWRKGQREDYLLYLIDFAKRGYVTASISYRLLPGAKFPAAVEDVKCAVRWLRLHAGEFDIDPGKIALIGGSAGGHLATFVGYSADESRFDGQCTADSVSSRVQAVINLYGPTDLTTEYAQTHPTITAFLETPYVDNPQLYIEASPVHYLSADDPPTLIFHGTIDELVPVSQSDSLYQRLQNMGIPVEYHRMQGWPHTLDLVQVINVYCQYHMTKFLSKYLPVPY